MSIPAVIGQDFGDSRQSIQQNWVLQCSLSCARRQFLFGKDLQVLPWVGFHNWGVIRKLCLCNFRSTGGCQNLRNISERSQP